MNVGTELIGWVSSFILLLTIGRQVHKQWQSGVTEGVSIWLFAGQIAASTGFAIYSWLVQNSVFVFTNTLMILSAVVGLVIVRRNRQRSQERK